MFGIRCPGSRVLIYCPPVNLTTPSFSGGTGGAGGAGGTTGVNGIGGQTGPVANQITL